MASLVHRGPLAKLLLLEGPDKELAGFGVYALQEVSIEGREHLVFDAGSYTRSGYTGSQRVLNRKTVAPRPRPPRALA